MNLLIPRLNRQAVATVGTEIDSACLRLDNRTCLYGRGPFTVSSDPPSEGAAFYVNDYYLSSGRPWWRPAHWTLTETLASSFAGRLSQSKPRLAWHAPAPEAFQRAFRHIRRHQRLGKWEKAVPVVTESGRVLEGRASDLAFRPHENTESEWGYAFQLGERGFAGVSPERLFALVGEKLRTMALAGTALRDDTKFATDPKEIREHEYVADAIAAILGTRGRVRRSPRRLLASRHLVHFLTEFEIETGGPNAGGLDAWVRRLHPTPALGPWPRNEETLHLQRRLRESLQTPTFFGAPFGAFVEGVFHAVILIRGIFWSGDRLALPSGCGVIRESRRAAEWRELDAKRTAVKSLFK